MLPLHLSKFMAVVKSSLTMWCRSLYFFRGAGFVYLNLLLPYLFVGLAKYKYVVQRFKLHIVLCFKLFGTYYHILIFKNFFDFDVDSCMFLGCNLLGFYDFIYCIYVFLGSVISFTLYILLGNVV